MFKLFNKNECAYICVAESEEECISIAASDLVKDIKSVIKSDSGVMTVEKICKIKPNAIIIGTAGNSKFKEMTENIIDFKELESFEEKFIINISDDNIIIAGSDSLGAIWGIYEVSSAFLGINPLYLFNDIRPEKKTELFIDNQKLSDYPKTYRFRGWFINDEDLLTDFKPCGGKRSIDYPYYGNVMNLDILEDILETALRLRINLIIPSSFVDIDNPDERKIIDAVSRRGMWITQHHVEPMGVSYFAFDNYMKKHGIDSEISYIRNKDLMKDIWRYYARKWAEYDKVIWQLGLRGKADEPIWYADKNVPSDRRQIGKLLTDAIQVQYDIIKEVTGSDNFLSTSTLWMEGAQLYSEGYLKFPKDTAVIFSDIGVNQMLADDFFTTKRFENVKYGIYYHVAYWGAGPHLAEGNSIDKMLYNYTAARDSGASYYSILNVSNIREFQLSAAANARLTWDMKNFDKNKYLSDYYSSVIGSNSAQKAMKIYDEYFECFAVLSEKNLEDICIRSNFNYHKYDGLGFANLILNDGHTKRLGYSILKYIEYCDSDKCCPGYFSVDVIKNSIDKFNKVLNKLYSLHDEIECKGKRYYESQMILQPEFMLHLYSWCMNIMQAASVIITDVNAAVKYLDSALYELKAITYFRKMSTYGKWKKWYRGDKKFNLESMIFRTEEVLNKIALRV